MIKVGLDIGNSKISCVVCDIRNDDYLKVLSFISIPTNNVSKGIITNLENIKKEIKEIITTAERESHTEILSIYLNIPAVDSISHFSKGVVKLNNEEISNLHIKKAINESDFLKNIPDFNTIYTSIINFEIDNNSIVNDPVGMFCNNLLVNFYKFSVKDNIIKNLKTIFNDLNIHIESFIPSPFASALSTLNSDDKILGTISIDLGASSTSVLIFENEKVSFIDSIKVGGKHITNDLARKFSTTIESAERLKTLYGSVITSPSDEYDLIDIPLIGSDPVQFKQINRSEINAIIKPRIEETLELVWQRLKEYNLHKKRIKNVVITGGGSLLDGIEEYVKAIFDSNVRIGFPRKYMGLNSKFVNPQFSQTLGIVVFNPKDYEIDILKNKEKIKKNTVLSQFSSWLDQYI